MFRVLFLMLLVLIALIAGPYIANTHDLVRIETNTKIIEMRLISLVMFFVGAMAVIYLIEWAISRFCRLSKGSYNWFFNRKQRKAQKETLEGLMRMSEGDYSKAEKLFSKNAMHAEEPVLNLIKAAEAAQQSGDEFGANKYLIDAGKLAGNNNVAVELARVRILMLQNKVPAARSAIDSLLEFAPNNSEVLRLAIQVYQASKAYTALDSILESIGQRSFLSTEEYEKLEHLDGLLSWWSTQPSRRCKSIYAQVGLIKRLIDTDDHVSAEEFALKAVKKYEDAQLLPLLNELTRLQVDAESKLVKTLAKRAEKAEEQYRDDYARALGYIYARESLFDKAKLQFELLLNHKECVANDRIMALYVAEQAKDQALVDRIQAINLQSANMVKAPEPVTE